MRSVLIVGAGPSGLVAAKELDRCGLTPLVLEKKNVIGGLWKSDEGSTWKTLRTNLSEKTCKFSDFPWPEGTQDFPNQQEMYEYFCRYAKHFNLEQYIHLNSEVQKIKKKGERWCVKWIENGEGKENFFKYIIIASGVFSKAFIPQIKEIETFTGRILHSNDYKEPSIFSDRRVLVLGNAFGGTDIAAEIATTAQKVIHTFRRSVWVIPRYIPNDSKSHLLPLDRFFFKLSNLFIPQTTQLERFRSTNEWYSLLSSQGKINKALEITDFDQPPYIAISDSYLDQVTKGTIQPKKNVISSINNSQVVFEDGTTEEIDDIICATGYETNLSYLDKKILQSIEYEPHNKFKPIILNRCTFTKDPTIGFIGMERGPYLGIQELQARLIAQVFSKAIPFPSNEELERGFEIERTIRNQIPQPQFPQNYMSLAEKLAQAANVKPNYELLKVDNPKLYDLIMNGVYDTAHFRLEGPHANVELALESIKQSNSVLSASSPHTKFEITN